MFEDQFYTRFVLNIFLGIMFVVALFKMARYNNQEIKPTKHVVMKIFGWLFIGLSAISLTGSVIFLSQMEYPDELIGPFIGPNTLVRNSYTAFQWGYPTMVQGHSLTLILATFEMLGLGLYFLFFKSSKSRWWTKIFKFLSVLFLFMFMVNATNFHYFDGWEFVSPVLFIVIWIIIMSKKPKDKKETIPVQGHMSNPSNETILPSAPRLASENTIEPIKVNLRYNETNKISENNYSIKTQNKENMVDEDKEKLNSVETFSPLKFCRHCGKQIDEESKYCKHCGKSLKIIPNQPLTNKSDTWKKILVNILLIGIFTYCMGCMDEGNSLTAWMIIVYIPYYLILTLYYSRLIWKYGNKISKEQILLLPLLNKLKILRDYDSSNVNDKKTLFSISFYGLILSVLCPAIVSTMYYDFSHEIQEYYGLCYLLLSTPVIVWIFGIGKVSFFNWLSSDSINRQKEMDK